MKLIKYQALGNDYLVLDLDESKQSLSVNTVKLLCNRNFGVGSDGILLGPLSSEPYSLKIYNPDGSEAEKSGNGLRIFSKYLSEFYSTKRKFDIIVGGQTVSAEIMNNDATSIKVNMGKAKFRSSEIPVNSKNSECINEEVDVLGETLMVNCVSMGNPHCVVIKDDISSELAVKYGPILEMHNMFPNRTNVQFAKVLSRNKVQLEIWERGAGYTLASGSSSCGAVSVLYRKGLVDNKVEVVMPGGNLNIEIDDSTKEIWMTGEVQKTFEVNLSKNLKSKLF